MSSHLHCVKITLKKKTGLESRKSKGVELFYILSGTGTFCNDMSKECDAVDLKVHDHIIIQPNSERSMSNRTNEDLVFLRITDSSTAYDEDGFETVVPVSVSRGLPEVAIADVAEKVSKLGTWLGIYNLQQKFMSKKEDKNTDDS
jgi:mannose-6-phosphate isomerase-like protein (cupin superfamily)